jgi:hypothetical protein
MQNEWGRSGIRIGYWWESQKERDHCEDQDVGGWTILKWISERSVEASCEHGIEPSSSINCWEVLE